MGIQFTQVLQALPVGSVISVPFDTGSPTYAFVSKPENLFALNGNQISVNGR
jgi:hypothetical protein